MQKPIEPKKPRKPPVPKAPSKQIKIKKSIDLLEYDKSLADLLTELPSKDYSQYQIESRMYCDSYYCEVWTETCELVWTETKDDPDYQEKYQTYLKKVKAAEPKIRKYKEDLKKWEAEHQEFLKKLIKYKEYKAKEEIKKLQNELTKP